MTSHRCFLPGFGSFGHPVSEEKIFRNQQIRNKNCLSRSCLLMNWDEMSNLYRGPSMDASYQVRFIWSSGFRVEEFCRNRPISITNCLWWPCLLRIEPKRTIFRGPSIYASYQVSIHLAKRFQRFLEIDQPETITAYGYSISEVKIF